MQADRALISVIGKFTSCPFRSRTPGMDRETLGTRRDSGEVT